MSDEQHLAALREEIRRAGSETSDIRRCTAGFLFVLTVVCFVVWTFSFGVWWDQPTGLLRTAVQIAFVGETVIVIFLMGVVVACPIAALGRWVRHARLHRKLTVLSPAQRANVLLPLR